MISISSIVPPTPPILYVTSTTMNSILLHWKAGDNGAAPLSAFTLNYRRDHGDWQEVDIPRYVSAHELKVRCDDGTD